MDIDNQDSQTPNQTPDSNSDSIKGSIDINNASNANNLNNPNQDTNQSTDIESESDIKYKETNDSEEISDMDKSDNLSFETTQDSVNNEDTENKIDTPSDVDIPMEIKERNIQTKKVTFKLLVLVFGSIIGFIVFSYGMYQIYDMFFKPKDANYIKEEVNEEPNLNQIQPQEKTSNQYQNDELRISFDYSSQAKIINEEINGIKKIEIGYSTEDMDNLSELTLKEGYIFKVATFDTQERELDQITFVKKESLIYGCPDTAIFSQTKETLIDGISARTFEIQNCDGDYTITYLVKYNTNYEITQMYAGGVGIKPKFKADTLEILESLKFYPEETEPIGPTIKYENEKDKIYFEYPSEMQITDKKTPSISGKSAKNILTLIYPDTYVDENNYTGLTLFIEDAGTISFKEYIEKQKNILIDDYTVVRGIKPETKEKNFVISDKSAVELTGYSWRGNTFVYVEGSSPFSKTLRVIVFSIRNVSGEDYDTTFENIINSLELK